MGTPPVYLICTKKCVFKIDKQTKNKRGMIYIHTRLSNISSKMRVKTFRFWSIKKKLENVKKTENPDEKVLPSTFFSFFGLGYFFCYTQIKWGGEKKNV